MYFLPSNAKLLLHKLHFLYMVHSLIVFCYIHQTLASICMVFFLIQLCHISWCNSSSHDTFTSCSITLPSGKWSFMIFYLSRKARSFVEKILFIIYIYFHMYSNHWLSLQHYSLVDSIFLRKYKHETWISLLSVKDVRPIRKFTDEHMCYCLLHSDPLLVWLYGKLSIFVSNRI